MNKEEIVSNDFLFEIEDKIYLITQMFMVVLGSSLLLVVFYLYDYSLEKIFDSGRLGRLTVMLTIPYYVYCILKLLFYVLVQKRKTIKFYPTYILISSNKTSIILKDIKKMYKLKFNFLCGKGEHLEGLKKLYLLTFFFIPSIILSFLSLYIPYQKISIINFVFINNKDEKFGGIAYGLLSLEEQSKVKEYIQKYLNINIDEIEQRLILLPAK
ncbi:hypothetical protein CP985_06325 [Malaciobacter mytili LMG 24559]|uniref:RDD domain-containing protein n=1 Tax=Malaciobacter mytili LMG 24559 TaxID=1032238 RepID=A0AAX2AI55_9BACT|nr:hypothetical protein [Malaciobacter mytili]AXH15460.1 putative membrane protein [Malaciobacter mytili LMG 24559]RXK15876.1 hypothetical protein CP985_06325 [Malaciobacter mytili LMG 24559]